MQCLFNSHSENICGYCLNPQHPYAMTWTQVNCKNCLGKQCKDFEIEPSHQIWHQRAKKKEKRKQRKQRLNDYVNRIQGNI